MAKATCIVRCELWDELMGDGEINHDCDGNTKNCNRKPPRHTASDTSLSQTHTTLRDHFCGG